MTVISSDIGVPYTRQTASEPLPGVWGSCPVALISSWASFPFEFSLPGVSRQVLHLPVMMMPDVCDLAIVFKPEPGKLGVIYQAKRATPEALTAAGTPLGGPIDQTIFPGS